jgi:hypothetical protein
MSALINLFSIVNHVTVLDHELPTHATFLDHVIKHFEELHKHCMQLQQAPWQKPRMLDAKIQRA